MSCHNESLSKIYFVEADSQWNNVDINRIWGQYELLRYGLSLIGRNITIFFSSPTLTYTLLEFNGMIPKTGPEEERAQLQVVFMPQIPS